MLLFTTATTTAIISTARTSRTEGSPTRSPRTGPD